MKKILTKNELMFETLFRKMNTISFYEWLKNLLKNNDYVENNDSFIGWDILDINNEKISIFQSKETEYGDRLYRINPIYLSDLRTYFEKNIKTQM